LFIKTLIVFKIANKLTTTKDVKLLTKTEHHSEDKCV